MKLIDTHAHLYWESFKSDFNQMIQRAVDAGVSTIINVGVDIEKSQVALDQTKNTKWPKGLSIYSTIGIHPHEALRFASLAQGKLNPDVSIHQDIEKLEHIYKQSLSLSDKGNPTKVVAVGECGLDYFFKDNPGFTPPSLSADKIKDLQKKLLQAQIELAKKLNLPLIVHCRDDRSQDPQNSECWDEVIDITKDHFGIYHCYSGLPNTTYKILNTNFLVAFAANITYPKNEYLREAVKMLPLTKILLETDSPFLAPQSIRGQRNEPATVKEVAQLIADLKGISFKQVATQTTDNAKRLFMI